MPTADWTIFPANILAASISCLPMARFALFTASPSMAPIVARSGPRGPTPAVKSFKVSGEKRRHAMRLLSCLMLAALLIAGCARNEQPLLSHGKPVQHWLEELKNSD